MTNDVLSGVGDGPFPHAAISAALGREETQFEVVPGSELRQAGSLTALLRDARDPACTVFLKKVTAGLVANKAWNDRRRVLLYIRNELRFYAEFADGLRQRGVDIPPAYFLSSSNLDGLEGYEEEPPPEMLGDCGALMFLEPLADPARFHQTSPLSPSQASTLLEAAARLHAAAWQDAPTLERAAARLQRHGGSFALSARNPKELANLADSWGRFAAAFAPAAPPGFFGRPEIAALGSRLQAAAPWIAAQLSPAPSDPFATLVHGDLKAMNAFLPRDHPDPDALLIDFASTGVGYGMADVAMHLCHALMPGDLRTHEADLLQRYLRFLDQPDYDPLLARRHYELATIDYGRFVLGRFWGAASPDAFWEKRHKSNVALVHRNVPAALHFVERLDAYLAKYEGEISLIT